jgi:hypothetical protein
MLETQLNLVRRRPDFRYPSREGKGVVGECWVDHPKSEQLRMIIRLKLLTGHSSIAIIADMWIDIDDAVRIYARTLRARLGSIRGAKAAQEMADHMRAKADWPGVKAWEASPLN